ncbi:hypothetical protein Bb109J_c1125 [Bdellovibrio bacteriovorus]|uniref:hypothetical protein n=1 Tax=Bdellovibrio bacteriovorus TaxID=959 RepID=UPI00045C0F5F|nr:hypothetical protein [Bdellovibrio bacteriovorus]AHZ86462.1 hypothetical protein EP01_16190 [Bdellovibrio bacteriovorus]BEV67705.1 hypothetical protein Bb109J_c1125 [Bdellovibrio bacteriovorus]
MKKFLMVSMLYFSLGCSELATEPSLSEESLEGGQWVAFCFSGMASWETRKAQYDGTNYQESVEVFADSYCNSPAYSIEENGTYEIPGKLEGSSMRKLDRTLGGIRMTPLSALGVSNLNNMSFCGYSDWALNVPREIAGLSCNGQQIPPVNTTYYDLFTIWSFTADDPDFPISKGDLNFGFKWDGNDGTTEELRPVSLTSPTFKRHPL